MVSLQRIGQIFLFGVFMTSTVAFAVVFASIPPMTIVPVSVPGLGELEVTVTPALQYTLLAVALISLTALYLWRQRELAD